MNGVGERSLQAIDAVTVSSITDLLIYLCISTRRNWGKILRGHIGWKAEKAKSTWEVDPLRIEKEKLNDLDWHILDLKANPMSEGKDNTPYCERVPSINGVNGRHLESLGKVTIVARAILNGQHWNRDGSRTVAVSGRESWPARREYESILNSSYEKTKSLYLRACGPPIMPCSYWNLWLSFIMIKFNLK